MSLPYLPSDTSNSRDVAFLITNAFSFDTWWLSWCREYAAVFEAVLAVCAVVGVLTLSYIAYSFLRVIIDTTLRRGIPLTEFGAGEGAWAVVTGCTDGIGRSFAQQLGEAGFHLVLVSRTQAKLVALAQELRSTYGIKTRTVAIDFAVADADDYRRLGAAIDAAGHIGILVNNVGMCHRFPLLFQDLPIEEMAAIVEVNMTAQLQVTKLALPRMLHQQRSLILNIGSFSSVVPTPFLSIYSSSKTFLRSWSQALGKELHEQGVMVHCVSPFYVVSKMSRFRQPRFMVPSADTYVRHTLKRIGMRGGSALPYNGAPYLVQAIFEWGTIALPTRHFALLVNYALYWRFNQQALRKMARLSKVQ